MVASSGQLCLIVLIAFQRSIILDLRNGGRDEYLDQLSSLLVRKSIQEKPTLLRALLNQRTRFLFVGEKVRGPLCQPMKNSIR